MPDSETSMSILKEVFATIVGGVILALSAYFLIVVFDAGSNQLDDKALAAYVRQKDILMLAMSLLGTVTGYYLGRVPAELRAQKAETTATKATDEANKSRQDLVTAADKAATAAADAAGAAATVDRARRDRAALADGIRRVRDQLATSAPAIRKTLAAGGTPSPQESAIDQARTDLDALVAQNGG